VLRTAFLGGKFVLNDEGFNLAWVDLLLRGPKLNPPVTALTLPPFAAVEGGKPGHFMGPGYLASNMLKKAPPERIKELLRIMDWLASPFGTAEDYLIKFGLPEIDHTIGPEGDPVLTERGNADANLVNWKYIVPPPQVAYGPGLGLKFAKLVTDYEKAVIPVGIEDPTWGLASPSNESKGVGLTNTFRDGMTDILAGRRPLSDLDQMIKDWQTNGGDQIRKEFQTALATA
jgi:putative aldouronate transport system substrate-binding protein